MRTAAAAETLLRAKTDIRPATERERRYWLAVAAADHAQRGKALGIMQVCHGKGGPLRRVRAGDGVVYYSPTVSFRGKDRLQAFTAIGVAEGERTYQVDMGNGFRPFRRDVDYAEAEQVSILPLLERLELTRGKRNWGWVQSVNATRLVVYRRVFQSPRSFVGVD